MLVPNGIYFERFFMNSGGDSDSLIQKVDIAWDKIDWDKYEAATVPEIALVKKVKKFIKDKCKRLLGGL